jgi:hypothetical protein
LEKNPNEYEAEEISTKKESEEIVKNQGKV